MKKQLKCLVLVASLAVCMAACGGSTSSSPTPGTAPVVTAPEAVTPGAVATGVFVDAPVKGLSYECGTIKGKTDDTGAFTYITGQPVIFKLGNVVVGTADGATVITPREIAKKADSALFGTGLDDAAKKVVKFLLSVGTVSANTLTITPAVFSNASSATNMKTLNILKDDITATVTALGGTLATTTAVDSHYSQYLSDTYLAKAKYAGRYIALNTAVDTGLDILVSPDGTVKGVAASTDGGKNDVVGTVDVNGVVSGTVYTYGTNTAVVTFTGTFADGKFTVTATTLATKSTSTWEIKRTTDFLTPVAGIYGGSFTGSINGTWGIIVLTDGHILGYANGKIKESCSGTVDVTGKAVMTCSGGAKINGAIAGSSVSGNWSESVYSGAFTGSRLLTSRQ